MSTQDTAREALSRCNTRVIRAENELTAALAQRDQVEAELWRVEKEAGEL